MRSKTKQRLSADIKLLGERLPGSPSQRKEFLQTLKELVEDYGEDWVRENSQRLLAEAEFCARELIF